MHFLPLPVYVQSLHKIQPECVYHGHNLFSFFLQRISKYHQDYYILFHLIIPATLRLTFQKHSSQNPLLKRKSMPLHYSLSQALVLLFPYPNLSRLPHDNIDSYPLNMSEIPQIVDSYPLSFPTRSHKKEKVY